MDAPTRSPGRTQDIVAAQGFDRSGDREVLLDRDGRGRLLFELATDPDHPRSDPAAAYENLLMTLEPGGRIRILQIFWPDETPRNAFIRQTAGWPALENDLTENLLRDLNDYLSRAPLPYLRRTFLEVVLLAGDSAEWIDGAIEILRSNGMDARPLGSAEVQELARWVFNPVLE